MERAASRLRSASSGSMPRSSGRRIDAALAQALDHLRVAAAADVGVARDAADRLLALVLVAAEEKVGDAFFGDDVGHVVGVDHDRREIELELLGERPARRAARRTAARSCRRRSRRSARRACGRAAAAPGRRGRPPRRPCSQGSLGWRRPRGSEPMLGAPPKPAMRVVVTVELLPSRSICSVEPMNMSQA